MKHLTGNLFHFSNICITTNGATSTTGYAIMGAGCAAQAANRYPKLSYDLGVKLSTEQGNQVYHFNYGDGRNIFTFPVKPRAIVLTDKSQLVKHMQSKFRLGEIVPGWACVADLNIIKRSAQQLINVVNDLPDVKEVIIPRPGCGCGELNWVDVKKVLEEVLSNRGTIYSTITFDT